MVSGVVYHGVARRSGGDEGEVNDDTGKLFSGLKLWFSHAVPQRKWLIENATLNGAEIVPLEKQADVRLVDHARKNNAPGTHSYCFVEHSIRSGRLEDLDTHRVGATSSINRPVGSTVTGPKGTRAAFTDEEDQFLWNIITPFKDKGGAFKGNEIYKQIAALRPRHTFQSWRDRYLKHVQHQSRTVTDQVDVEAEVAGQPTASDAHLPARVTTPAKRPSPEPVGSRKRPRTEGEDTESMARANGELRRPHPSPTRALRASPEVMQRPQPDGPPPTPSGRKPTTAPLEPSMPPPPVKHPTPSPRKREGNQPQPRPETPNHAERRESTPCASPETTSSRQESPKPNEYPDKYPYNFTRKQYRKLFRATQAILETDKERMGLAFDNVAEDNKELGHSGRDWRLFWQETVLPAYCRQFGIDINDIDPAAKIPNVWSLRRRPPCRESETEPIVECAQCLTKETTRWRRDRQGRTLCNDCDRLFKESRLRSMSGAHTDVPDSPEAEVGEEQQQQHVAQEEQYVQIKEEEGELPPLPPLTTVPVPTPTSTQRFVSYSDAGVQTSPILGPQVIKDENELPEMRPPGPNEARKRSAGRSSQSNSQESLANPLKPSHTAEGSVEARAEEDESTRPIFQPLPSMHRQRQSTPVMLEIPSTPEHTGSNLGAFAPEQSPIDSPAEQLQASLRYSSPLFVPQEDTAGNISSPTRRREGSSPLEFQLLDEDSLRNAQSSSLQRDHREGTPMSESAYNFETAPNVSEEWETAPQSPERPERRLSTQALLQQSYGPVESHGFDLPEPEGGWEQLGISNPTPSEFHATGTVGNATVVDLAADSDDLQPIESASQAGNALRPTSILLTPPPALSIRSSSLPPVAKDAAEESELEIDEWLAAQCELYPATIVRRAVLEDLLSVAIDATSFDYDLAASIIPGMIAASKTPQGRAHRKAQRWKALLPSNKRGVWTETDDLVMGPEVEEASLERVFNKHGAEGCMARREFLQAYAEA